MMTDETETGEGDSSTGEVGGWSAGESPGSHILPLLPLLERSCSDCGVAGLGGLGHQKQNLKLRKQGKFRRVLSETW